MKLRKRLTIGLCAFYLMSIIGIALNMHFCGGTLSKVSFTETVKCNSCKKSEKKGQESDCCKNTSIDAKIKDSHKAEVNLKLAQLFSTELFLGPVFTPASGYASSNLSSHAVNKAPPLSTKLSLHLYNCVFII